MKKRFWSNLGELRAVSKFGLKLRFLFILVGSRISEFSKPYYPNISYVNINLLNLQIQQ